MIKAYSFLEFLNEAYIKGRYYNLYPEEKDYNRISDIIKKAEAKAKDDDDDEIKNERVRGLSSSQAKSIDDPGKAMRRARAALEFHKGVLRKDLKDDDRLPYIAKFFLNRAIELGVTEQEMDKEEAKLVRGHHTAKLVGII